MIAVIAALGAAVPTLVTATSAPVLAPVPAPVQPDAERRQLTVMFCGRLDRAVDGFDPENLRELIDDYDRAVSDFDGFVAKYMGGGVLVYFG